ncbi:MAG: fused MFS/spermidine synthase [Candidatus Magasanikbacteria bacterium]|nr:fused MFS/spermidine synthase [Candidatus Magasanikbacteria bacterium]
MRTLESLLYDISVFITGASILIVEILASRIVAPFIGTSLIAWTSIIGVVLASLSAGYYIGGILADKKAHKNHLALIILSGAAAIVLLELIRTPLLSSLTSSIYNIKLQSVLVSILLFAPFSFLLAMVSPYTLRLDLKDIEHTGRTSGRLSALSTFGSIAGTFLSGFLLIPYFSTSTILLSLATMLTLLSLAMCSSVFLKKISLLFFAFVAITTIITFSPVSAIDTHILAERNTPYHAVQVVQYTDNDGNDRRSLKTDRFTIQSSMYANEPNRLASEYLRIFDVAKSYTSSVSSTLLIGGGTYSYPKHFLEKYPEAHMDVIEIDPGLTAIAQEYFFLEDSERMDIFHQDGRTFLQSSNQQYDAIYLDAFLSFFSIPFHLTTEEFANELYSSLEDHGAVVINLIDNTDDTETPSFLDAMVKTYESVFPYVDIYQVEQVSFGTVHAGNIVLVAAKQERDMSTAHAYMPTPFSPHTEAPILSDDFAPVDQYILRLFD